MNLSVTKNQEIQPNEMCGKGFTWKGGLELRINAKLHILKSKLVFFIYALYLSTYAHGHTYIQGLTIEKWPRKHVIKMHFMYIPIMLKRLGIIKRCNSDKRNLKPDGQV